MEGMLDTYLGGVQTGVAAAATTLVSTASAAASSAAAASASAINGATEPDDIPQNAGNAPVWILGRRYEAQQQLEQIRRDVRSRLWCTYRRGFAPIGEPGYTTDRGWGCMLRCGQMILAQALIELHLGRDWRWTPECRDPTYLKIVKRFEDHRQNPYSIHTIALMGDSEDKRVGEWFGPNTVSQVLKKLVGYDDWSQLSIHVALDNMIAIDEILTLCVDAADESSWRPLLLIVPLRLGLADVNPIYIDALKRCFQLESNVGMIGGRPNQALFFIGYVGDEALYLDPHTTQSGAQSVGEKCSDEERDQDATFHQRYAGRIAFRDMDPSLALAFVCRSRSEFDGLCAEWQKPATDGDVRLFEVAKSGYRPWQASGSGGQRRRTSSGIPEEFVQVDPHQSLPLETEMASVAFDESDEEFEFIE